MPPPNTQTPCPPTPIQPVQGVGSQATARRCYNYKDPGHLANNCPLPRNITPVKFNLGNTPAKTPAPGAGQQAIPATPQTVVIDSARPQRPQWGTGKPYLSEGGGVCLP
ncbi:hypothetical protein E2562_034053 [Oryza meyeriana var. granulata]|uniref:CCHC-type domain-containing protein n=1 Tax=Oryza meyeriana var. granulata TaxID=110450 RepID=A0A6G1CAN3_9ORYZ|nr:hypothetical protein E2562_034053 [Oryza meyeriana var. granulata]